MFAADEVPPPPPTGSVPQPPYRDVTQHVGQSSPLCNQAPLDGVITLLPSVGCGDEVMG